MCKSARFPPCFSLSLCHTCHFKDRSDYNKDSSCAEGSRSGLFVSCHCSSRFPSCYMVQITLHHYTCSPKWGSRFDAYKTGHNDKNTWKTQICKEDYETRGKIQIHTWIQGKNNTIGSWWRLFCCAKRLEVAFGISFSHIMNNQTLATVIRHLISKPSAQKTKRSRHESP